MTKLEAVKKMLRLVGGADVTSLVSDDPDVEAAVEALDLEVREKQRRGWWFNLEYGLIFEPDDNGLITIGNDYTSVYVDGCIVQRGTKLYDQVNNTNIFSGAVNVEKAVRILPWELCPESFTTYATYEASREFIRDILNDPNKDREIREEAAGALSVLRSEHMKAERTNMFNSARTRRARSGVRPYRGTSFNPIYPGG